MQNNPKQSRFDQPATYLIKVKGRLDPGWAEWFGRMEIQVTEDDDGAANTCLTGPVVDQVALYGLIARHTRDLNLILLTVQRLGELPPGRLASQRK